MNANWLRNMFLALTAFLSATTYATAAETMSGQPFTEYGTVNEVGKQGELIISDNMFHLGDQAVIQKLGGKSAGAADLKPGVKVGFNVYGTDTNRYISEIWILPESFDPTRTGPVALPGHGPMKTTE